MVTVMARVQEENNRNYIIKYIMQLFGLGDIHGDK